MQLDTYVDRYPNIRLERTDGILTMTLHTDGGPLVFDGRVHEDFGPCFTDIGSDPENDILIITGAGDGFIVPPPPMPEFQMTASYWAKIFAEGTRLLGRLLDLEIPVIGAVNGRATLHAEIALLSDVVICSDDAVFADHGHFPNGFVPGDGVHFIWPLLLGLNRARYFLTTGQVIDAREAHHLGLVGEVVSRDQLLPRAHELARQIQRRPPLTRRYTRLALTHEIKLAVQRGLGYGLAMEGLAAIDHTPRYGEFE